MKNTEQTISNFLPAQYDKTDTKPINHNYLREQFADFPIILEKIAEVVKRGDFTLGRSVDEFEVRFSELVGVKHAIGVGSGTDAIFLALKALGIGEGDEVIAPTFTFYATIGAIATTGARPVFVDSGTDYNIDVKSIEKAITPRTKAIVPVHWSGKPCEMDMREDIAQRHQLFIVEDGCHGITATYKGRPAGSYGNAAAFSMHPLKNLNVWGDGGVVVTNDDGMASKLRLMRNHGLRDRDTCDVFAYNSRLDTIQAVVGNHLIDKIADITEARIENAAYLDRAFEAIPGITIPPRGASDIRQVFHIYSLLFERRDELKERLEAAGVDAKIHYPVPMHLQPAASGYGYSEGDFPVAEQICKNVMSLPVHEFIERSDLDHIIHVVRKFYQ